MVKSYEESEKLSAQSKSMDDKDNAEMFDENANLEDWFLDTDFF